MSAPSTGKCGRVSMETISPSSARYAMKFRGSSPRRKRSAPGAIVIIHECGVSSSACADFPLRSDTAGFPWFPESMSSLLIRSSSFRGTSGPNSGLSLSSHAVRSFIMWSWLATRVSRSAGVTDIDPPRSFWSVFSTRCVNRSMSEQPNIPEDPLIVWTALKRMLIVSGSSSPLSRARIDSSMFERFSRLSVKNVFFMLSQSIVAIGVLPRVVFPLFFRSVEREQRCHLVAFPEHRECAAPFPRLFTGVFQELVSG